MLPFAKNFMCIIIFNIHNSLVIKILLPPILLQQQAQTTLSQENWAM